MTTYRIAAVANRIESNQIPLPDIIIDPNQFNVYYMSIVSVKNNNIKTNRNQINPNPVTFMKKSEIEEEQRKIKIKDTCRN